ncbi:MAG TPA: YdeI/OmpD-associated family protein [Acidimicrobiia bacterium]
MSAELPELLVPNAAGWRSWLEPNHGSSPGVRLVLTRKGGEVTGLTYEEAVDEAVCFGWIDGQGTKRDEGSYRVRFTPRTRRSQWSMRNVERVARLEAEAKMADAGRAAVEAAQADGRWEMAYAGPASAEVPEDLLAAIAEVPAAQAMFDVLTSQNRFALISRLGRLKTEAARRRRIDEFVAMLARHEVPYPQRRKP